MPFSKYVSESKSNEFYQFKTSAVYTLFKAFMSWMVLLISVNGSWSQWSSWQPCSVTCGGGNRTRTRTCSYSAPKWNRQECSGTNTSTERCNLHECKGRCFLKDFSLKMISAYFDALVFSLLS